MTTPLAEQVASLLTQAHANNQRAEAMLDQLTPVHDVPDRVRSRIDAALADGRLSALTLAQINDLITAAIVQLNPCPPGIDEDQLNSAIQAISQAVRDLDTCCPDDDENDDEEP